jgi:hypothetical protein
MKRLIFYVLASGVLVLFGFAPAYAVQTQVPEPGTMAVLGAIAAGGLIAGKIIKRK